MSTTGRPESLEAVFIAKGQDSEVYKSRGLVVKVYNDNLFLDKAILYKVVTRKAFELLESEIQGGELTVGKESYPFRYRVNPIDEVFRVLLPTDSSTERVVVNGISLPVLGNLAPTRIGFRERYMGFSNYIPGPRMVDYIDPEARLVVDDSIKGIEDAKEAEILRRIAQVRFGRRGFFRSTPPQELFKQEEWNLYNLAYRLQEQIGVTGIIIDPVNVKLRADSSTGGLNFIITDLCSAIGVLVASLSAPRSVTRELRWAFEDEFEKFNTREYELSRV